MFQPAKLFSILIVNGFTYIYEQTFLNMDLVKNKLKSRLNDIRLDTCLKLNITNYFSKKTLLGNSVLKIPNTEKSWCVSFNRIDLLNLY